MPAAKLYNPTLGVFELLTGPGAAVSYSFAQVIPADSWTIAHNLGGYPSVTVVNSAGDVVIGSVRYISNNEILITFSAGFAGMAYLS